MQLKRSIYTTSCEKIGDIFLIKPYYKQSFELRNEPNHWNVSDWCLGNIEMTKHYLLHDRSWISRWIKSRSNISFCICPRNNCNIMHCATDCDVITRIRTHWVRHGIDVWRSRVRSSFVASLCCVRNELIYVLWWQTVFALTRVLIGWLIPSLLRNLGNKHLRLL